MAPGIIWLYDALWVVVTQQTAGSSARSGRDKQVLMLVAFISPGSSDHAWRIFGAEVYEKCAPEKLSKYLG